MAASRSTGISSVCQCRGRLCRCRSIRARISSSLGFAVATKTTFDALDAIRCANRLLPLRAPPSTSVTHFKDCSIAGDTFSVQFWREHTLRRFSVQHYGSWCEDIAIDSPFEVDRPMWAVGRSPDLRILEFALPSQAKPSGVLLLELSALTVARAAPDSHRLPKYTNQCCL